MRLPSELVSTAVRGTTKPSEHGNDQTADALLRLCGVRSFQTIGGFVPKCDHQDLYTPYTFTDSNQLEQYKLRHLHIILNDHPQMIEEWIQAICEMGHKLPDEYIPYFLQLGCQQPHLQSWLKLIVSDTANWLITRSHIEHWNWFNNCKVESIQDVLAQQLNENRAVMYEISVKLASQPLNHNSYDALKSLSTYAPMWSAPIAKVLIKAMFVSNVTATYYDNSLLVQVVRKAAYRLPLIYADEFLAELRTGAESWHHIADELDMIFTMRRDMLATIREGSDT